MTSSRVGERTLAASLIAFGLALGCATSASAEPDPTAPPAPPPAVATAPIEGDAAEPAVAACRQFAAALRVSTAYYNNFAYSIAGDGARVDYQDPAVTSDNVEGRAALRKSAAEALSASGTPGLQREISSPMRVWSLRATKLLIVMGVRGDGTTLNKAASELNDAATDAQMACANTGAQPLRGGQDRP